VYAPAPDDEITGLANQLDQQLAALRAAVIGLTDEQARSQPCASVLSVAGLLKHVTHGMVGVTAWLRDGRRSLEAPDEAGFAAYQASFALGDDETAVGALKAFDAARADYLAAVRSSDPDADTIEPPAPWHGIFDARPAKVRYRLIHQVEEMARHAGHADILREQIDGTMVPAIVLSQEGMGASDFFQPYVPAAGTLGAA
jgi:hypothetical protein